MLRTLFRRPRTIRVPIDSHTVGVQTVNVRKPHSTALSRFILMGAVTTLTIQGMKYLDPLGNHQTRDIFQEQLNKAAKEEASKEKDDKHQRQRAVKRVQSEVQDWELGPRSTTNLRLTIPIWIRKGGLREYSTWDPEFKDFAKLQSDEKRMATLRQQVFDTVLQSIKASPPRYRELVTIGFNGKVAGSLDVVPQLLAPSLYQVPCLWIAMDHLSLQFDWRELEQETGARIERVFRPLVVLEAATHAAKTFLSTTSAITMAKFRDGLNFNPSGAYARSRAREALVQQTLEHFVSKPTSDELLKSPRPFFPSLPDINDGPATRRMHQDIVSAMPYSLAIQQAASAFNHVKTMRQKAAISANLRGICQIRGYITFFGSRGKFRMEVVANYLPGENVFVGAVEVKQRFVARDYAAMQKMKDAIDQKRAEAAAKKAFEETEDSKVSPKAADGSLNKDPPSKHDGKEKE